MGSTGRFFTVFPSFFLTNNIRVTTSPKNVLLNKIYEPRFSETPGSQSPSDLLPHLMEKKNCRHIFAENIYFSPAQFEDFGGEIRPVNNTPKEYGICGCVVLAKFE